MAEGTGFDVLIKNGRIVDGTGREAFAGAVGITGQKLAAVGADVDGPARTVIDAGGKVVAPGFIDPHAHLELLLLIQPDTIDYVAQGITTAVNGNCGHSVTPYRSDGVFEYHYRNGLISETFRKYGETSFAWDSFSGYLECAREQGGTTINHATLLGHGTLRWSVMNGAHDRPPSPEEAKELTRLVEEGLEQGAVGMSTGLAYIPSRFASTEEIVELARVLARHDATYASHVRYQLGVEAAVAEAVEIGRRSGARVQVSHLFMNEEGAYQVAAEAVAKGDVDVGVDTIARSTGHLVRGDRLIQFIMTMTPELFDVGVEGVLTSIRTPEGRARTREVEPFFKQDPATVYIVNTGGAALEGKTVAEVAAERGKDPSDLMFDLLLERGKGVTFWFGKNRNKSADGVPPREVISYPWMSFGTDTIMVEKFDPTGWYEPLRSGGAAHFLRMALAAGVKLEEAIRRMTSLQAERFRLAGRGALKPGMYADAVVFEPEEFKYPSLEEIDYAMPVHLASGMEHVIVNGNPVWERDRLTGARPGAMLERGKL